MGSVCPETLSGHCITMCVHVFVYHYISFYGKEKLAFHGIFSMADRVDLHIHANSSRPSYVSGATRQRLEWGGGHGHPDTATGKSNWTEEYVD